MMLQMVLSMMNKILATMMSILSVTVMPNMTAMAMAMAMAMMLQMVCQ
jgi:hypothetical protein